MTTEKTPKDQFDSKGNQIGDPGAPARAAAAKPEPADTKPAKGVPVRLFLMGAGPTIVSHKGTITAVRKNAKGLELFDIEIDQTPQVTAPALWENIPHLPVGDGPTPFFRVAG